MQPLTLPIVLHENLVVLFKFYRQGTLHDGIRFRKGLYGRVRSFALHERESAYALGLKLSELGDRVVITITGQHYRVWLDLRSQRFAASCSIEQPMSQGIY